MVVLTRGGGERESGRFLVTRVLRRQTSIRVQWYGCETADEQQEEVIWLEGGRQVSKFGGYSLMVIKVEFCIFSHFFIII